MAARQAYFISRDVVAAACPGYTSLLVGTER